MESTMSRRQFNQNILPKEPPVKYNKLPKRAADNRRCTVITKILLRLKSEAGDKYSLSDLAKECYVKEGSVRLWFYGRPYGQHTTHQIARYFAPLVRRPLPDVRRELEEARVEAWSQPK